jgi:hypothetical protein
MRPFFLSLTNLQGRILLIINYFCVWQKQNPYEYSHARSSNSRKKVTYTNTPLLVTFFYLSTCMCKNPNPTQPSVHSRYMDGSIYLDLVSFVELGITFLSAPMGWWLVCSIRDSPLSFRSRIPPRMSPSTPPPLLAAHMRTHDSFMIHSSHQH